MSRCFSRVPARACMAMAALSLSAAAHAVYPDHPITIVVPFNTGTTPDIISRLLAAEMGKESGANFVVLNRVGASGIIGTQYVANAAPDGYTIAYANVSTLAINQSLFRKLPYDADEQLAPVAYIGEVQNVLAVRPGLNVKSVDELIALAKKEPGKLVLANGGNGTTGDLSGRMFTSMARISVVNVPYKGGVEADMALVRGEGDLLFDNISSMLPFINQGQVIPLAVTGSKRDPVLPQLPTLDELGLKGYHAVAWMGYVAPAATDPKILDWLNQAMNKALAAPDVREKLKSLADNPSTGPRRALFDLAHQERPVWAKVVKDADIHID